MKPNYFIQLVAALWAFANHSSNSSNTCSSLKHSIMSMNR